jgi:hypothetical protein
MILESYNEPDPTCYKEYLFLVPFDVSCKIFLLFTECECIVLFHHTNIKAFIR